MTIEPSPATPRSVPDLDASVDRRKVLLVLRTPPPFGGGEMIAAELERLFTGRYRILSFQRPGHTKATQGRLSGGNLAFGLRYIARTCLELVLRRPTVLYLDIPKDRPSFVRSSVILAVASALRVRVVGDLAGGDFPFLDRGGIEGRLSRRLLSRLHAIRVLGDSIGERLRERGLSNAVAVSNGIARPAAASLPAERRDQAIGLLYVGKVGESKGIFRLLAALAEGGDRPGRLPWHLDVAGEWESEAVRAAALEVVAARGLADRVTFHGLAVDDAKWALFRRAHLLVHPTDWDGQPVTILEAFAFGLPVVSTRVGAIPDTVTDGIEGIVVTDTSPATLVAAIDRIAEPSEYQRYSDAARAAFAARYETAVFERSMAALFDRAARDPSAAALDLVPPSTGWS